MYQKIIPYTYYYLSVVEGNLENKTSQKRYYQEAVLYLVSLLDIYGIDMHKDFYNIINKNQIEKLFTLINNHVNQTIDKNEEIINEGKIIDDFEYFEKEVNKVFVLKDIIKIGNYSFAKCQTLKTIAFQNELTHKRKAFNNNNSR